MEDIYINEDKNPDNHIRIARVVEVFSDPAQITKDTPYGSVKVEWVDGFGSISKPIIAAMPYYSSAYGSGIIIMPAIGDIVTCMLQKNGYPIVIGWIPRGLTESVNLDTERHQSFNSDSGQYAAVPKLQPGEVCIKGSGQSSVIFQNNGAIKLSTCNPSNIEGFTNSGVSGTRIKSTDNTEFEQTIGPKIESDIVSSQNKQIDGIVVKRSNKLVDIIEVIDEPVTISNNIATFSNPGVIAVNTFTIGNNVFKINDNFNISNDRTGIVFKSNPGATTATITYKYEYEKYSDYLDAFGNSITKSNSLETQIGTKTSNSAQNTTIVGEDGDVYFRLKDIDSIISERLKVLLSDFAVNFTDTFKVKFVDKTTPSPKDLIVPEDLTSGIYVDDNVDSVTECTGICLGTACQFKPIKDYTVSDNYIRFIGQRFPDPGSTIKVTYNKAVVKGGIELSNGGIVIDGELGEQVTISNKQVNISGVDGVNLGGDKQLLYSISGVVTKIEDIGVCQQVTGK